MYGIGIKGDFAGTAQKIRIIQDFVQLRFVTQVWLYLVLWTNDLLSS